MEFDNSPRSQRTTAFVLYSLLVASTATGSNAFRQTNGTPEKPPAAPNIENLKTGRTQPAQLELSDFGILPVQTQTRPQSHSVLTVMSEQARAIDILLGFKSPDGKELVLSEQVAAYVSVPAVSFLQRHLPGVVTADGKFGPQTADAVRAIFAELNQSLPQSAQIDTSSPLRLGKHEIELMLTHARISHYSTLEDLAAQQLLTLNQPLSINPSPSFNPAVQDAQCILVQLGTSVGPSGADGRLGPLTKNGLLEFELRRNLPISADGELNGTTAVALLVEQNKLDANHFNTIRNTPWFSEMPDNWKTVIEERYNNADELERDLFLKLTSHPVFSENLDTNLRSKLLNVFYETNHDGKMCLISLLDRKIGKDGNPAILDHCPTRSSDGNTVCVVDKLHDLACGPLQPALENSRAELICAVVQQLANPFETNQGPYGRCSGDVIDFYTLLASPGIGAELSIEPLDADGILVSSDGATFSFVPGSENTTGNGKITKVESIVQSMLISRGPTDGVYDPVSDCIVDPNTRERVTSGGIGLTDIATNLNDLFGHDFTVLSTSQALPANSILAALLAAPIGTIVDIKWKRLRADDIEKFSPKERETRTDPYTYHVVNYLGCDLSKGVIYVRTWGRTDKETGKNLADHSRDEIAHYLFDKDQGIYAIPILNKDGSQGLASRIRGICFDTQPPNHLLSK